MNKTIIAAILCSLLALAGAVYAPALYAADCPCGGKCTCGQTCQCDGNKCECQGEKRCG